jgi:hypothetical protein
MTSSSDANLFPPSHFFHVWKQEEVAGAKSREYGGCGSNSQPNSTNFAEQREIGVPAHWLGGTVLSFSPSGAVFPSIHRQMCPIIKHNTAL